jgi:Kdo2-lipid IVA lauroyltransferase/acyltransferase
MGHMAGTVLGPAVMSIRTGAPILPNYCVRLGPNKYKIIAHEPMLPDPDAEDQAADLMTRLNASLESMVRQYPEQWLWFHDRWKSARRKGLVQEP